MLSVYRWQQVKVMRSNGISIKGIARRLKISKNTVRRYLRDPSPPVFKARKHDRVLDTYEEEILGMMKNRYIGTRIYEELKGKGYEGSLSAVHRYIQRLRTEAVIREKVTTRFETAPGKQMQYDWTVWTLPVTGRPVTVYFHEVVLGYSRKKYYTWSLRIKAQDVIRAIESGIWYFGGVCPELVIDNPKQEVVVHKKSGVVCYADEFLRFCGMYGLEPNACRPYRARTKGKVERPFYYLEEHLLRGLEVSDLAELDGLLDAFALRYNARPHSSLKESPDARFEREKVHLRPIPSVDPALIYTRETRKISSDGYVSCDGLLYPVPMGFCLRGVMVEVISGRTVRVYDLSGNMIAEHAVRLFDKGRPEHPEHAAINDAYIGKKESYRAGLIRTFVERFPDQGDAYVAGLRKNTTVNMSWHLEEILGFSHFYKNDEIAAVLDECIRLGAYHKNTVKRLLGERDFQIPLSVLDGLPMHRAALDITRSLSAYRVEVAHA
ncbi:MAG: IS21 family transposase [Proteobacteria bacterium]|nr:IS21 family transposase [Pseudomonadota bacterium]